MNLASYIAVYNKINLRWSIGLYVKERWSFLKKIENMFLTLE